MTQNKPSKKDKKDKEAASQASSAHEEAVRATETLAALKTGSRSVLSVMDPLGCTASQTRCAGVSEINVLAEQLCLEEMTKIAELDGLLAAAGTSDFERLFFACFHPVKSAAIFLAEPLDERQASSRLMQPVLCGRVMAKMLESPRFFVESVALALLFSGHISLYHHVTVVDRILSVKSVPLLLALLASQTDLPDPELAKMILFMMDEERAGGLFEESLAADQTIAACRLDDTFSLHDSFLLGLLTKAKSVVLLKKYFLLATETQVILLLEKLTQFLVLLSNGDRIKARSKGVLTLARITDWLALVIDSQYPLVLMQPRLLAAIEAVHVCVQREVSMNETVSSLLPFMQAIRTKSLFPPTTQGVSVGNATYTITPTDL